VNGLQDVAKLENTMQGIHQDALASSWLSCWFDYQGGIFAALN
jgi:hypothetical protein